MTDTPSAQTLLRDYLTQVARRGQPVTYRHACNALGITPPGMIQTLARLLEDSMRDDARAGRPFLAALVVSQSRERRDLPAPGFFATARALGRLDDEAAAEVDQTATLDTARRFHEQELAAVRTTYG
ncbi:hypothetical protein [Halomonas sp. YLGW01]|uniref:hypothetical protein n=1 Tax=Halomonas sp. YLGW01 TaxID=2773308 RepID=UPI001781B382|nr:hypothetical protein [Halomonas sp. YLGW01]